jgi:hypothetical membrane protein
MKRPLLFAYQLLTGASDASAGLLLLFTPALTLRLMGLHVETSALPFVAYIGAFVLSVGAACLYGALLVQRARSAQRLETVWLLTAITRALVAVFVTVNVVVGTLQTGWMTVAMTDGALALLQAIGLYRGWLNDAGA